MKLLTMATTAIIGIGVGMLVSPKSGKENRELINSKAKEASEKSKAHAKKASSKWQEMKASYKANRESNDNDKSEIASTATPHPTYAG